MHQNQAQLRSKLWYIPKSTAQCGDLQPHQAGWHTQRAVVLPLSQMNLPHRAGGHIQRASVLPLSHEPAPLGRGDTPKEQGPLSFHSHKRTFTLGRGAHPKGHHPSTFTNKPAPSYRVACSGWGISSGARRHPPKTPRKKEKVDSPKQTNKQFGCNNKQKPKKHKTESRGHSPSV